MAITRCYHCNQRHSDKLSICPHCGQGKPDSDELRREQLAIRAHRQALYKLRMLSYVAMTIFMAGAIWYLVASDGFLILFPTGPTLMLFVGMVAFLVIRAMIRIQIKRFRQT